MTEDDCLKLTVYFGERDRVGGRLLADVLIDVFAAHELRASILLRGAEGFGRLHHLRTDRLLSLSEDLPVTAIAVDSRRRIQALVAPVLEATHRGLITLERARMLTGQLGEVRLPEQLHEATKLTVYVGRRQRAGGRPAHVAICDLLRRRGIAGATVLLGVDGTREGRRTRARLLGPNANVPTMVMAVGNGANIARVLPELGEMLAEPLITLERVRVCKRDGELLSRPHQLPSGDADGLALWQKLTVYTSQSATVDGRPLHLEIIRRLRASQSAGATCLRGIWGFHGDHEPRGDRFLQIQRGVPVITVSVDTPEQTAAAFAIVDELTAEQGLVTSEMIPAMSAMSRERTVGGLALASFDF